VTVDLFSVSALELAQSDTREGFIWRILVERGEPMTTGEIQEETSRRGRTISSGGSVNRVLRALTDSGWVEHCEVTRTFNCARRVPAWAARKERDPSMVPGMTIPERRDKKRHAHTQRIFMARQKITELVDLAHRARYSAIAVDMGAALYTIETELREVRNSLSRHGVHKNRGKS
jgi:Fe2+ or Zn2+ uptake regulation protein